MKIRIWVMSLFAVLLWSAALAETTTLPQRVLYVGERADAFEPFLKEHFKKSGAVSRADFKVAQAEDYDVVVLDWPQGENARAEREQVGPLGPREAWRKPTVLMGSAGLNLAVAWKLKGGSGCTCLAPVAYGWKDHEIFKTPIPVNLAATTNIATPITFAGEIKTPRIEVLPLVDNIRRFETVIQDYQAGWATHYFEFADMPDVEWFTGGINSQTPRSAAFWRQGNLLHFGFQPAPTELNATGRGMLVNAIAYISRFTEDRPIDITPSVFAKERNPLTRQRAKGYFVSANFRPDYLTNAFTAATLATFDSRNRTNALAWFEMNGSWLHPATDNLLEVDNAARELGTPYDAGDFLPKTIGALRDGNKAAAAKVLLARYAPEGPGAGADAAAWDAWWQANAPYLFFSEQGCYRWYVDPLAKKRGAPSKGLRGPLRAEGRS